MRKAATARPGEVHRAIHPVHTAAPSSDLAELVGDLMHRHALPAELQHLRHELEILELPPIVESRENLCGA
jgi:hypothetical protein